MYIMLNCRFNMKNPNKAIGRVESQQMRESENLMLTQIGQSKIKNIGISVVYH